MSINPEARALLDLAADFAKSPKPVLCFDTCILLDCMEDPTTDVVTVENKQAELDILDQLCQGDLHGIVSETVVEELNRNMDKVHRRSNEAVDSIVNQQQSQFFPKLWRIGTVLGINASDLEEIKTNYSEFSRKLTMDMFNKCTVVADSQKINYNAVRRMKQNRKPARLGTRNPSGDCVIFENLLLFAWSYSSFLKDGGATEIPPIVFVSSNKKDFQKSSGVAHPHIAADLTSVNPTYARSLSAAREQIADRVG